MRKLLLIITMLSGGIIWAQDSLQSDSIQKRLTGLTQQLENYEKLLEQTSEKRKQDSLARVDLLMKIQLLEESDKVNKASLRDQIRAIELRDSARNAQQRKQVLELRNNTKAYIVAPLGDSLFAFYTKLGPALAEDRAISVTEKIELLVSNDFFYPDSLIIQSQDGTIDVVYSDLIVTSVSEWDVLWVDGVSKDSLANSYKSVIEDYVLKTRNRSSIQNIAARIGLVFLIIGGVALALYFIGKIASGTQGWMVLNRKKYFTGLRMKSYELLPPDLHLEVSVRFVSTLKWGLYILTFYLSLPMVFGLFPFTRGWAQTLLDWVWSPTSDVWYSFWDYIPNVFTIVVIYIITRYLVKFIKFIAGEIHDGHLNLPGFYSDWAMPTYRLAKLLIYAFMLVMVWPYLPGSDSDIFKGVAIFIGLLIALGSTSAVGNVVAGLVITYMRPYRVGDRVKIGEVTGEVVERNLLVTRFRTPKNEDITVPNSSILTGHTINYSSSSKKLGLILNTSVTIGYDVPWRKVHELLVEAAVATDGVNISREPFVLQTSLDDCYVSYQLNAYTDVPERMQETYSELHANIQDKFNEAKIEIMSPHYQLIKEGRNRQKK